MIGRERTDPALSPQAPLSRPASFGRRAFAFAASTAGRLLAVHEVLSEVFSEASCELKNDEVEVVRVSIATVSERLSAQRQRDRTFTLRVDNSRVTRVHGSEAEGL